jgi:hypothetical protein
VHAHHTNDPGHGRADDLDLRTPSVARMYDYYLGGKDNYAVDRDAAEQALHRVPNGRVLAEENRAFLRRVVRYLAGECGIRQFLDIGSGLPTQENVHQVAQAIAPDCRVVYVDNDHCKSGCAHDERD